MEPLITLVVVTLVIRGIGAIGVRRLNSWDVALRVGLAAMFVLTGGAHFVGLRSEMIAMVPPALPMPGLLVTVTGILEFAGAAGLLWRRTAPLAAGCLWVLLIVMFPSNVYAAQQGIADGPFEQLLPRTVIQLVFLAATAMVVLSAIRRRRQRVAAEEQPPAVQSIPVCSTPRTR